MIRCPFNTGVHLEAYNLLICRPTGKLTARQMNDIAICRECILKAGLLQINRFHDLTGITAIDLSFEDVRNICETESRMRKSVHPIKACYLVPNDLLYGTIRMYQALIERRGVEVHVSYSLDEIAGILGIEKSAIEKHP